MKKLFFILFLFTLTTQLEAQYCGCPCLRDRYYNPGWADEHYHLYGYIDINDYPYTLPVNRYFNPRPCPNPRCFSGYNYRVRVVEQPQACCPRCNGYHY